MYWPILPKLGVYIGAAVENNESVCWLDVQTEVLELPATLGLVTPAPAAWDGLNVPDTAADFNFFREIPRLLKMIVGRGSTG